MSVEIQLLYSGGFQACSQERLARSSGLPLMVPGCGVNPDSRLVEVSRTIRTDPPRHSISTGSPVASTWSRVLISSALRRESLRRLGMMRLQLDERFYVIPVNARIQYLSQTSVLFNSKLALNSGSGVFMTIPTLNCTGERLFFTFYNDRRYYRIPIFRTRMHFTAL